MTTHPILDLPMKRNDAKAKTVRAYLVALLKELWNEKEGFSGWEYDLYAAIEKAKIEGDPDTLIASAIIALGRSA